MGFVQIIELHTSRFEELEALHEQWLADTEGTRTVVSERICRGLPATNRIAEGIAALADEPPGFPNLDLVLAD